MRNIIYDQISTKAQPGTEDKITVLKKLEEVFPDNYKKIISDSIDGNIRWHVEHIRESYVYDHEIDYNLLKKTFLTNNIIYYTGAEKNQTIIDIENKHGIKIKTKNPFEWETCLALKYAEDFIKNKTDYINKKTYAPFNFICYNRYAKLHRFLILANLKEQNLLDNAIYSWHPDTNRISDIKNQLVNINVDRSFLNENQICTYDEDTNISKNVKHSNLDIRLKYRYNFDHPLNSYFLVATETFYNDTIFFTEKTYKAFLFLQPFVFIGNHNSLDYLRSQGYDLFDDIIDHSYDLEKNLFLRVKLASNEIKRLCDLDWPELLHKNLNRLIKNYKNVVLRSKKFKSNSF